MENALRKYGLKKRKQIHQRLVDFFNQHLIVDKRVVETS